MAYLDVGEGPAVVLLHGYPTSSFLWREIAPLLSARMRVIAPDLIGYGHSEKPVDADLSLRAQTGYVRELLRRIGIERFAVVGHGFGGGIAQLLAFQGDAAALGLIDSVAFDAWPSSGTAALQREPPAETVGAAEKAVMEWLRAACRKRTFSEADADGYLEPWRADPAALVRALRGLDGRGLERSAELLEELDTPAFVIWGEDDAFLPSDLAERIGEALPGSMVALLPGCGHLVSDDAPGTVAGLVHEFLRRQFMREGHRNVRTGPVRVYLERPSDPTLLGAEAEEE
jgi:pimeloyl-ACP methyl ester carboxylesterase